MAVYKYKCYRASLVSKHKKYDNFNGAQRSTKLALFSLEFALDMKRDKIFLNTFLVSLYFFLFGWDSVQLYLEGGVIINRKSEVSEEIKQPSIIIAPGGPNILPRKVRQKLLGSCRGRRGPDLQHCIENVSSSFHQVVLNISHPVHQESMLIHSGLGKIKTPWLLLNLTFQFT